MLIRVLFKMRATRLVAATVTTLAAMAVGLLLAPDIAHAWEVNLSVKGAGKVTETTPRNLVSTDCSPGGTDGLMSANTTPTGTIGGSCSPGSPTGIYSSLDIIEYKAEPKEGYRFVRWQNDRGNEPNIYNPVLCDGSDGRTTYTGTTCRFQIFQNLQVQAVFEDVTPPQILAISGPFGPVNGPATFTWSTASDPTLRGFECRVRDSSEDGILHDWQGCSSGHTENPPDGIYGFDVRAVDWSGNLSSVALVVWQVDKTLPSVTLTSPSSDGAFVSGTAVALAADASDNDAVNRVDFLVDNVLLESSDSSFIPPYGAIWDSTTVPDGPHTITARALDPAGNSGVFSRTVMVDNILPSLEITDVRVREGNSGTKDAVFTVRLTSPGQQTVRMNYTTANGTAREPGDYTAKSGRLTFLPGQTSKMISVPIRGDTRDEPNETFFVRLSGPTNTDLVDPSGRGTIVDND